MPFLVPALVAIGMSLLVAQIVATVISIVVSMAISFAISAMMPKPKSNLPKFGSQSGSDLISEAQGRTVMIRSSAEAHRVIYGRSLVSGPILFTAVTGTDNSEMHIVVGLAGHEIEEIEAIYLGDELSESPRIVNYVSISKHYGTADQAVDPDLVLVSGVTSTDRFRGIAYIYAKLTYNAEIWLTGLPNIRALVKGKKVYDPRTGLTVWSDNAALCQLDYLMSPYGINAATSAIDLPSWIAAANICDESVDLKAGGVQKRYLCNGTFQLDRRPIDVMEELLSASAGTVIYCQGQYRGFAAAYDIPTISLNQDDLRGDISFVMKPARRELFNGVRGVYIDPIAHWQATDFAPVTNEFYEMEDGEQLLADIQYAWTIDSAMAQRLSKIHLERHRKSLSVTFPAKLTALKIAPWDTVMVTIPHLGWSDKVFRVLSSALTPDAGVDLTMREESPHIYAWDREEIAMTPGVDSALPNPYFTSNLLGIRLTSGVGVKVESGGNTTHRIKATWTAHTDVSVTNSGYIEVQYKKSVDSTWLTGIDVLGHLTEGYLSPVEVGTAYDVRARAVNALGVASYWAFMGSHVVGDTTIHVSVGVWLMYPATAGLTAAEV